VAQLKRLVLLAGLLSAVLAATSAVPSSAATPCWKQLINDWLDGRIDQLYPVACYRQAIDHLPADIQQYSSARQDIMRAMQARIEGKHAQPNRKSSRVLPGGGPGPSGGSNNPGGGNGPIGSLLNQGRPSKADSVPLPIIVLAAIAGVLLLLGVAGFLARRMQSRRPPMRPAESSAQPPNR
jgi:hypothetical protein